MSPLFPPQYAPSLPLPILSWLMKERMPSSPGQQRNSGPRLVDKVGREMLAGLATITATPAAPTAHFKLGTSQQGNQVCSPSKMLLSHSNPADSPMVYRALGVYFLQVLYKQLESLKIIQSASFWWSNLTRFCKIPHSPPGIICLLGAFLEPESVQPT